MKINEQTILASNLGKSIKAINITMNRKLALDALNFTSKIEPKNLKSDSTAMFVQLFELLCQRIPEPTSTTKL